MFRFGKRKSPAALDTSENGGQKNSDRRKIIRWSIFGTIGLVVIVVGAQLVYPRDKSLPYAMIQGKAAGNKTLTELTPLLQEAFDDTTVTLKAGTASASTKLSLLGATLNTEKTARALTTYTTPQRLVPFSVFWLRPEVATVDVDFDETQLNKAVEELAGTMTSQPKNGTVKINDKGEVEVVTAEDGASVTVDHLRQAIKNGPYHLATTTLEVIPDVTKPAVTNDMINGVKTQIASVLSKTLTLKDSLDATASYTPDKATMASWLVIGDDLKITLDKGKLADYTNQMVKAHLASAGTTKVTVVDGVETGRVNAPAGRGVNLTALSNDVAQALFENGSAAITVQYAAIAPSVSYSRTYSSSQAGLQAYVSDVTSGGTVEVSVQQLTGASWSASGRSSKSVVAASTYKMFVSLLLFDKINAGQIKWSDAIQGTTVDGCLTNTIVVSANNCAEQWLSEWGRANVNAALYAKGFSSATSFTTRDASQTSAGDLEKLLIGLQNRTMFNASDADKLLALMKRQVYRKGIPTGSAGTVADKVGFLWDYLNDAAVVYHPKGTYVLVIMTKGESWAKIAEITKQIETIMYP